MIYIYMFFFIICICTIYCISIVYDYLLYICSFILHIYLFMSRFTLPLSTGFIH